VPSNSDLIYQTALLTSELASIFDNAPKAPQTVMASDNVQKKFKQLTGSSDSAEEISSEVKRRPVDGDW
jgi:hypothetical protein